MTTANARGRRSCSAPRPGISTFDSFDAGLGPAGARSRPRQGRAGRRQPGGDPGLARQEFLGYLAGGRRCGKPLRPRRTRRAHAITLVGYDDRSQTLQVHQPVGHQLGRRRLWPDDLRHLRGARLPGLLMHLPGDPAGDAGGKRFRRRYHAGAGHPDAAEAADRHHAAAADAAARPRPAATSRRNCRRPISPRSPAAMSTSSPTPTAAASPSALSAASMSSIGIDAALQGKVDDNQ